METHVNGWPIIEATMIKRHVSQRSLARLLDVTPAAISQAKNGTIMFNWGQLASICSFLKLPKSECGKLFSEIMNARYQIIVGDFTSVEEEMPDMMNFRVHCSWKKRKY